MKTLALALTITVMVLTPFTRAASINIAWDPNPPSEKVVRYSILVRGTSLSTVLTNTTTGTNFTFSSAVPGGTYTFSVTAINSDGLESDPSSLVVGLPFPSPTPILTSSFIQRLGTNWIINLNWEVPPPTFQVRGYWVTLNQGVLTTTFTTNPFVTLTVPIRTPTSVSVVTSNSIGVSMPLTVTYSQPGAPARLRQVVGGGGGSGGGGTTGGGTEGGL